jgi:sulfatase modifying factor 1
MTKRTLHGLRVLLLTASLSAGCSSSNGGHGNGDAGAKDATSSSSSGGSGSGGGSGSSSGVDSGSSSGTDSGSNSGGDGGVCAPNALRCNGAQPQVCNAAGTAWQDDGATCSGSNPACLNGACVACSPGATQCSGNSVETCGATGQWGSPWACATGACSGGACTGSTTSGTSCSPGGAGMTNCGVASESCCTSTEVVGGTYYRTYDFAGPPADGGATSEADPASVSGFRLDRYLVTVGRFRQFVAAWNGGSGVEGGAGYEPTAGSGKHSHLNGGQGLMGVGSTAPPPDGGVVYEPGWVASDDSNISPTNANLTTGTYCAGYATWTNSPGSQENLPINCVTWPEAYAFCIWDGGFLPSEAEWEYAAAGGNQQRTYPWGSTDPGTSNQYGIYGNLPECDYPDGGTCTGVVNLAPVGTATLGAGLWGHLDMAGELYEWTRDSYDIYVDPCVDCTNLRDDTYELRGGDFADLPVLASARLDASKEGFTVGFRCARTP